MGSKDKEEARNLRDALKTSRDIRKHWQGRAGALHRLKQLLRKAGVPMPRPRRPDERD